MKKSLYISIAALIISIAALVKVYMCCPKAMVADVVNVSDTLNVEEILTNNPEIVINAMQKYEQKMRDQAMDNARALISENIEAVNNDPSSPYVGNKDAKIVLVEFFDYACGYCHRLFPEMKKIIAKNPDVKVVYKPLAFLSPASDYAARAVLSAAQQGKFNEMNEALFAVEMPLDEDKIDAAAAKAGVDVEKMKQQIQSEEISVIMNNNNELAGKIQVGGVPTLVLNGEMLQTIDGNMIQEKINGLK